MFTLTTSVKVLEDESRQVHIRTHNVAGVSDIGYLTLQPAGVVSETKVVFVGADTTIVALSAALGPLSVPRPCM